MATLRQFSLFDTLHYNNINLDILTQPFSLTLLYIIHHTVLFIILETKKGFLI